MDWPPYISDDVLDEIVARGLAEDVGPGDVTTLATVPASAVATGRFTAKEGGVLAGGAVTGRVFRALDKEVNLEWQTEDGVRVGAGQAIATISGPARAILIGERLALNILQRMSGIATATRRLVDAVAPFGTQILDTRKTVPGLRVLDKWAVLLGGGRNHRVGLFDMILIKDNHIAAAGSLEAAVESALRFRRDLGSAVEVELEVTSLEEVEQALALQGIDILLLDNMIRQTPSGHLDVETLRRAVNLVGRRIRTEASGNMDLESAVAAARCGVDYVSVGGLTHSPRALDISLTFDVERAQPPRA